MDAPAKLLADDAWAADDGKIGFLNVGVDFSFNYIYKDNQYPWP